MVKAGMTKPQIDWQRRAAGLEQLLYREIEETDKLRHKIQQAIDRLHEMATRSGDPLRTAIETIKILGE